jgi:hypothetical protein
VTRPASFCLLLLTATAPAAPALRAKPTMADVYGEVIAPKEECQAAMARNGELTLTVPTTAKVTPDHADYRLPQVSKTVDGDFTLTARVTLRVPAKVGSRSKEAPAAAYAGLTVFSGDVAKFDTVNCHSVSVRETGPERAVTTHFGLYWTGNAAGGNRGGGGRAQSLCPSDREAGSPVWLRIAREGEGVTVATSEDGKEWHSTEPWTLIGPVQVGAVAYGCVDQEFSATFDEYELKVAERK